MSFDWKKALGTVAPVLAGLVGGPIGVVASAGAKVVAQALGVPEDEASISAALQAGLTPEQRSALIAADADLKKAQLAAQVRYRELESEDRKQEMLDVQDARSRNAGTVGILRLGYFINAASYFCVALVLAASFWLMGSSTELKVDPGIAAMLGGIVGSAVQWLLLNASQANGFFFGSSPATRAAATKVGEAASRLPLRQ